jgi:hypothetical protein
MTYVYARFQTFRRARDVNLYYLNINLTTTWPRIMCCPHLTKPYPLPTVKMFDLF